MSKQVFWGPCPQAPGIYRFAARMTAGQAPRRYPVRQGGAALAAPPHSGTRDGAQVASPQCPILRSGILRVDNKNPLAQPDSASKIYLPHFCVSFFGCSPNTAPRTIYVTAGKLLLTMPIE
jgi:hypothetical protein